MKTSPLRLNWITYPEVSYKSNVAAQPTEIVRATISAVVRYALNGAHTCELRLSSSQDDSSHYTLVVDALASFGFDLEIARDVYKSSTPEFLATTIAVNVTRILYASAREMVAIITARAPFGSAVIESLLIEPPDVRISSDEAPEVILQELFGRNDVAIVQSEPVVPKKTKRINKPAAD